MTNEELAQEIKAGRDDLQLDLWEQVKAFIHQQAYRAFLQLKGQGGVTAEDLAQSGYIAMLRAAKTFDPDAGASFIHHLSYMLRTEFAEAGGYRGHRRDPQYRDPMNFPPDGRSSLDAPVPGTEEGGTTYLDFVSDPAAEADFADAEDRIFYEQLHAALDVEIDRLPPRKAEAVRLFYWDGETQTAIAERQGVTVQSVHSSIQQGVASLRRGSSGRRLRDYLEERTNYFASVGVSEYQTTGTSAVEKIVLRREQMEAHYHDGDELRGA